MTPCQGNAFLFRSHQQLPFVRLGPLKGFWADTGPQLALCIPSGTTEIQGHCVRCAALCWSSQNTVKRTAANLDCVTVETYFFTLILDCEKPTDHNWLGDQIYAGSGGFSRAGKLLGRSPSRRPDPLGGQVLALHALRSHHTRSGKRAAEAWSWRKRLLCKKGREVWSLALFFIIIIVTL